MHPADELHLVRTRIRALRDRESELRAALIAGEDRAGARWLAEVRERTTRRLDAARLPLSVRADPRSFLERRTLEVALRPRADAPAEGPGATVHPLSEAAAIRTGSSAAPSAGSPRAGR